jgi:hypothetical protein
MPAQVPSACRGHAAHDVEDRESGAEDLPSLLRCPTNSLIEQNAGQRPGVSALLLARGRSLSSRAALRRDMERPSPWEPSVGVQAPGDFAGNTIADP